HTHEGPGGGDGGEWRVPAGNAVPEDEDVGCDPVGLERGPGARASGAAQDLVGHEEDLVPVADLTNPAPELRARNAGARRRPADRLRDERGDGIRALVQDRRLERITTAGGTRRSMSAACTPIDVRGGHPRDGHEPVAVC